MQSVSNSLDDLDNDRNTWYLNDGSHYTQGWSSIWITVYTRIEFNMDDSIHKDGVRYESQSCSWEFLELYLALTIDKAQITKTARHEMRFPKITPWQEVTMKIKISHQVKVSIQLFLHSVEISKKKYSTTKGLK